MKALFLLLFYIVVAASPLALAWLYGGPPRTLSDEIASGLGLMAFSMILIEFVLSGRFRAISSGVGMDVTMRVHQLAARTALVFALLHPFLYVTPSGPARPWDPTRQLVVTAEFWPIASGIAAFVLLPALVLLAVGRKQLDFKYETWRLLHGVGAALIAGALLHHATQAGRYSAEPELAYLWVALTGLACGSLVYVYLLKPVGQLARPWRVSHVENIAERTWSIGVAPDGHAGLSYRAGQFVWLNTGNSPFSLKENPLSLGSAPGGGAELEFIVKELGDWSRSLSGLKVGTRAYVDGPFGNLTVAGRDAPGLVLVAGGVGISPLLSILRAHIQSGDTRPVKLIYGNRAETQIVHRAEIDALAKAEGVEVTYVLSQPPEGWQGPVGRIDAGLIFSEVSPEQVRDWLFVLCGPTAMMDVVEEALIARGASSGQILSERFDYD
ncbi:MAG: ferredoxin reductase family protein [Paracoccaceae bacterium]